MTYNLLRPCVLVNRISFHQFCRSTVRLLSMEEDTHSGSWGGVPLSEILGSQSPWVSPEYPLVMPSATHTVLYEVPANGVLVSRPPVPVAAPDKWDSDHVRLPCSPKSLYPCKKENGEMVLRKRWPIIERALNQPIRNSKDLANAILTYNTKFEKIWTFRSLHALFDDHLDPDIAEFFFTVTMPLIAKLALQLPKLVQAPIPLLKQNMNHSISLSQQQIGCLMANAFFCTFPRRNTSKRNSEYSSYPHINFSSLYEAPPDRDVFEKITCLCNYLRHVSYKAPRGTATFTRRSAPPRGRADWARSRAAISALPVHVDSRGRIEDADGLIQLDFANKYLGGGVLGRGCVQEEIRFVICPELMVSMLFAEVMRPNEAFLMIGCQRYNKYVGYGRSFRWDGDFDEHSPRDRSGRRRVCVLAVDALPYTLHNKQFTHHCVTRELNKAWIGFSAFTEPSEPRLQYPGLATGNWGCGAFGGYPGLKTLIQLMAAAEARRPMAYFTFGDAGIRDQLIDTYNLLARYNVTVGQLYQYIMRFCSSGAPATRLHQYLQQLVVHGDARARGSGGGEGGEGGSGGGGGKMDTSPTPPADTSNEQKHQQHDSPDLFSTGDDTPSTSTSPPPPKKATKLSKSEIPPQTKRLFDELQKFDEESGTLNFVKKETKSKHIDSQKFSEDLFQSSDDDTEIDVSMDGSPENKPKIKMAASETKISDSDTKANQIVDDENDVTAGEKKMADSEMKMAASEDKMAASTSRLFEEMEKFDEEHGRLNLTVPSTSYLHETAGDSMVIENEKVEVTSEKKKITKKITDYFSKKPT